MWRQLFLKHLLYARCVWYWCYLFRVLGVYAYVTLKEHTEDKPEEIKQELRAMVKKSIGGFAVPEIIQASAYPHYLFILFSFRDGRRQETEGEGKCA